MILSSTGIIEVCQDCIISMKLYRACKQMTSYNFGTLKNRYLLCHSWVLKLMSHYNLHIFSSYILIPETPYVLSSTLHPNLAKQICGQAEVVICLQALYIYSASVLKSLKTISSFNLLL